MAEFIHPAEEKSDVFTKVLYTSDLGFHVIINNKIHTLINLCGFENYAVLYSLPNNDKHEPWTERPLTKIQYPKLVGVYWSIYKPGDVICVRLVNDIAVHDPTFELNK